MLLKELITEKYDPKHKCLTPGAIYSTEIHSDTINVSISLPMSLQLSAKQSEDLEADIHYAIESVLARLF